MDGLLDTGWGAIILLAILLLAINLSLFSMLRRKKSSPPGFLKGLNLIKDPWEAENQQWLELNAAVKRLEEPDPKAPPDS